MMTQLMPIMFLFIFYTFPSGLNLYWLCSTVFSFAGQLTIQKSYQTPDVTRKIQTHERSRTR
jgi:membrane protein insertase Oxa1/YidC/SpoIIIJ